MGITHNRRGSAGGGFRRPPGGYGAFSGGARIRGRPSGFGGKKTEPYMQKTPADHAGGNMAEGSSVRSAKRSETEKNEIFSEKFLFSVTTLYSWGNERLLAENG